MSDKWQNVFDGRDLEAYLRTSEGNATLAITFDYMSRVSRPPNIHASSFFRKSGCDQFHIVCKEDIWYQTDEIKAVCDLVRSIKSRYSNLLSYGNSMGAYGAILISGMVAVDTVIAFSPQFSVDPKICPQETRWKPITDKVAFIFDDLAAHISYDARVYVVFDPLCREDARHAKLIASLRPITEVRVHNAGHFPAQLLQETGSLDFVMKSFLADSFDEVQVRHLVRQGRRSSPNYFIRLAGMLSLKNRTKAAINAATVAYTMDPESSTVLDTFFGILSFSPQYHAFSDMAVRLLEIKHPDAEYYKMYRRNSLARLRERYAQKAALSSERSEL